MAEAPSYLTNRWKKDLEELFAPEDQQDVLDWLIANHGRKRVILVGSGFSLNSERPPQVSIPLWADVSNALARDLRIDPSTYDPLTLADFHRKQLGKSAFQARLLGLLDDRALKPGVAHAALWQANPEAVITTNS